MSYEWSSAVLTLVVVAIFAVIEIRGARNKKIKKMERELLHGKR